MPETIEYDQSLQPTKLSCTRCVGATTHTILKSVDIRDSDGHGHNYFDWHDSYQIARCGGCGTVSFRTVSTNSEDFEYDEENNGLVYNESEKIYPPRLPVKQGIAPQDIYFLSAQVREILEETHRALANEQPILAGIGARALIETIVKERQASGNNLFEKIDGLVTQQILTPARASVLHKIRTLGNDAAHEAKPHDAKQLALAIEVIENVLQEVYILPKKADATFK